MRHLEKGRLLVGLLVVTGLLPWCRQSQHADSRTMPDPGQSGPCSVSTRTVSVERDLQVDVYYPSEDSCGDVYGVPYPALVFAHGFSMFGLSDGPAENADNGTHLASWGYVVAIPRLPDDSKERLMAAQGVLTYLEDANGTPGSFIFGRVDTHRLAAAGHSLGGTTALALAAQDPRIKAVVALDPVYHAHSGFGQGESEVWDPTDAAPDIHVPACVLGAPPQACNSDADYAEIYPWIGSTHKASFLVVAGSHCDFADPGNPVCRFFCSAPADPQRTQLIQKLMTAWFNYYLCVDTDCYTYIYGIEADADVAADRIERQVSTASRHVAATGRREAVALEWELYGHPVVAGYNIYRRQRGGDESDLPFAQVGRESSYLDMDVEPGEQYLYVLRSRDGAGQEHQPSDEVSAVPEAGDLADVVYVPLVIRTEP